MSWMSGSLNHWPTLAYELQDIFYALNFNVKCCEIPGFRATWEMFPIICDSYIDCWLINSFTINF